MHLRPYKTRIPCSCSKTSSQLCLTPLSDHCLVLPGQLPHPPLGSAYSQVGFLSLWGFALLPLPLGFPPAISQASVHGAPGAKTATGESDNLPEQYTYLSAFVVSRIGLGKQKDAGEKSKWMFPANTHFPQSS